MDSNLGLISNVGLRWGMSISNKACLGLRSGMLVSDGTLMKQIKISDGSPVKHVGIL